MKHFFYKIWIFNEKSTFSRPETQILISIEFLAIIYTFQTKMKKTLKMSPNKKNLIFWQKHGSFRKYFWNSNKMILRGNRTSIWKIEVWWNKSSNQHSYRNWQLSEVVKTINIRAPQYLQNATATVWRSGGKPSTGFSPGAVVEPAILWITFFRKSHSFFYKQIDIFEIGDAAFDQHWILIKNTLFSGTFKKSRKFKKKSSFSDQTGRPSHLHFEIYSSWCIRRIKLDCGRLRFDGINLVTTMHMKTCHCSKLQNS